jgi:hypothetical protein
LVWSSAGSRFFSFIMDLKEFLYLAALVVFAMGCRTFENRYLQKLGWVGLLLASYLLGWWLTGSHVAGTCGVLTWFLLPWLEIVGRVRKLRFPIKSEIKHRFPPSRELFPQLGELTREAEALGYEEIEDAGWSWDGAEHFVRLFYHAKERTQATIALAVQGPLAISHVSLTSRLPDGRSFTTSNFPFAPSLQFSAKQMVNRDYYAESLEAMKGAHRQFLDKHGVAEAEMAELNVEQLPAQMERDMSVQIDHNIEKGLIEPLGNGEFRYSWRGCFFLWFQVVKDMVRV